jgi:hypothetical protein
MRIRGIKFICDRCGAEEFCELDENGEFKHGCSFHSFSLKDDTHLCDDCHNKLHRIIDEFMKENADD